MSFYSADFISPKYGSTKLAKAAAFDGSYMAESHYPYAIVNGPEDLRSLALQKFEYMWEPLSNKDRVKDELPEIKRIYVSAFTGAYRDKIDELRQRDAGKKAAEQREILARQQAEREKGALVEIKNQRQLPDGVLYMVKFFDPERMTQAVSFGVSVKDDGVVELEEI
jgi:hypothetical protein